MLVLHTGVQLEVTRRSAAISDVVSETWKNFTAAVVGTDTKLATKADNAALAAQVRVDIIGWDILHRSER